MKELIQKELYRLEKEKGIKVLYACESGSRAWGYPSKDSDYDARFIYVHQRDWYLSIDTCGKRDQIELPITDDLDIAGWELRKSLNLLAKSNAALLEWLDSPIIYHREDRVVDQLQALLSEFYNPIALMGHYYSMCLKSFETFSEAPQCKIKKLFYALRAALALEWSFRDLGPVPMIYHGMVDEIIEDDILRKTIADLEMKKRDATESTLVDLPENIRAFITDHLEKHQTLKAPWTRDKIDRAPLNALFLDILGE